MTGEISLNGKVLPIGGVKEKTMAATREGLNRLIFPKANERDIDKLPANIRDGVQFHFVEDFRDVFKIIFQWASNLEKNPKIYRLPGKFKFVITIFQGKKKT